MPDRPLRVAIDARSLNVDHLRGMGKGVQQLVQRTAASGAIEWHLLADRPDRPMHTPDPACRVELFEMRGYRFHSWEQIGLPRAARAGGADLLHAPATSAPWWQPVPTVVTIHDVIPWQKRDGEGTLDLYRDHLLPAAYHRAAAIITISQSSRRDILARWPALKPKLHVVANGVDERYLAAEPDHAPIVIGDQVLKDPYFLYLGGADPRKRLMWAMQAWWKGAADRARLVICGLEAGARDAALQSVPRELRDKVVIAPFVDEAEMPRLYMRAAAVLYPSLYEGFGLPVIEAQAVGTPVLFSDVGSLGELNGPGAMVLPVDDMTAWVRTVATLLDSRRVGMGPDRIAREWARQYSWDATVERTLAVYDAAVPAAPQRHHDRDLRHGATP